jgi:peptide-methionine (S)-S-oxide reductase
MKHFLFTLIFSLLFSCQNSAQTNPKQQAVIDAKPIEVSIQNGKARAYFASGCFWCVEAIFESVKGVKEVISGYAGGKEKNPTYEQVGGGFTSHAEAVEVYYDPKEISFTALVQVFFGSHDPTTLNRQGPDRGRQYRSVAFYKTKEEKKIIDAYIVALKEQNVYNGDPITTEVTKFTIFYPAEDYHQDYERKNPNNSYVRNVSVPRLNRFKKNFSDYLKENIH